MEGFSDDDKFEVDHIVAQRKRKGIIEYLVQWKGAGKSDNSWEPAKTIAADCTQAVESFTLLQKTLKSHSKSKSRSKSRSRSNSRSRKTTTETRKSSRSRSRGRPEKQKASPATSPADEKDANVRRSLRQSRKSAAFDTPEDKPTTNTIETKSLVTDTATPLSSFKSVQNVTNSSKSSVEVEESDTPRRSLRSSTMEKRDTLEVQRVHNDQKPVREDDGKPRSPIWKVADYIVIVLFVVSACAAVFLFLEKFVNLDDFKKQALPNFGVLKGRLAGGTQRVMELGHTVGGYFSDAWLYFVEQVKMPVKERAVPK